MRVNRTFSIPIELVQELKKKHNQSETVTRALRKYLEGDHNSSIADVTTRQLMAALLARNDIDETMKALLLQILTKQFDLCKNLFEKRDKRMIHNITSQMHDVRFYELDLLQFLLTSYELVLPHS